MSAAAESNPPSRGARVRKSNQVVSAAPSASSSSSTMNGHHHPAQYHDGGTAAGSSRSSRPNSRMENGLSTSSSGNKSNSSSSSSSSNGKHYDASPPPAGAFIPSSSSSVSKDHPHVSHLTNDTLSWWHYGIMLALVYISYATYPGSGLNISSEGGREGGKGGMTLWHVWYFGWITALSTGLGTLPFVVVSEMNKWWLGVSNACAAGMMLAASTSLVYEGIVLDDSSYVLRHGACWMPQSLRVLLGLLGGLLFIVSTKRLLDQHEDVKVAGLDGLEARKVLLLIFVMTLHSFTEGVGIGVSFGGDKGAKLGVFISLTLAVHNVPEGLAVALVLVPKGVNKWKTALWSIFTSIPQPLMAVPAYCFVESFIPFLPVGLGFAAGAMLWVAVFELLIDALEDTGSRTVTAMVGTLSFGVMMAVQMGLKED